MLYNKNKERYYLFLIYGMRDKVIIKKIIKGKKEDYGKRERIVSLIELFSIK